MSRAAVAVAVAAVSCAAPPVAAQSVPPAGGQPSPDDPAGDVVVAGRRPPGSAIGQADPIAVLDQQALRALGAQGMAELLRRLKPLTTGSGGGDPVFLLNGRRLGNPAQIQSLPPEAIERVEVLPEEEAARFGFPPTMRVLNLVTVKRFRSTTVQQLAGTTTEGGGASQYAEATGARIDAGRRATLQVSHFRQRPVRQDQRGIAAERVALPSGDTADGGEDVGAGRYLQPLTDTIKVDGTLAQPVAPHIDASLNLAMEATRNLRRNGLAPLLGDPSLDPVSGPAAGPVYLPGTALRQRDTALTLRGTGELHGSAGRWTWDATAGYEGFREAPSRNGRSVADGDCSL